MFSRNTYLELNIKNIQTNVEKIICMFDQYKYYFGVVKANCYGHNNIEAIKAIIKGGCNYLAVATLEEALEIRKEIKQIPILCLGHIDKSYIHICIENQITVTIHSLEYIEEIEKQDCLGLKIHLKLNTGMNRLGVTDKNKIKKIENIVKQNGMILEGIYTHIYNAREEESYLKQIKIFEEQLENIDLDNIKIIHISASEALEKYKKTSFVNGCRLGIIMYGFTEEKSLKLKSTMKLISQVIQVHELKKGDTIGYNGAYQVKDEIEKIAVVSIGYADGIIRKNTGRFVYIYDKKYEIVGNICMDMLFVKVDDKVNVDDKVVILKDIDHIKEVAKYLETIPYEILCSIGERVPRICK